MSATPIVRVFRYPPELSIWAVAKNGLIHGMNLKLDEAKEMGRRFAMEEAEELGMPVELVVED